MRSDVLLRCAHYVRVQLGAVSQTQRFAATQSTPRTPADRAKYQEQVNNYHRERAAWKRQMTELRKQWMQEHSDKVATEKAEAEREEHRRKERMDSALAASGEAGGQPAQLQRLQQQVRDAELAHEVAVEKLKRAERAAMRRQILDELESKRFAAIEEQSRSWITREQLEQRINDVLDTPASLDPPPPPTEEQQTL